MSGKPCADPSRLSLPRKPELPLRGPTRAEVLRALDSQPGAPACLAHLAGAVVADDVARLGQHPGAPHRRAEASGPRVPVGRISGCPAGRRARAVLDQGASRATPPGELAQSI